MSADPRLDIVDTVRLTDVELRHALRNADAEANRILATLDGDLSRGAQLRRAQVAMAQSQLGLWKTVEQATRVGIGDAFDASATWMTAYNQQLFGAATGVAPSHLLASQLATSRAGLQTYLARATSDKHGLSQSVYRNSQVSHGIIENMINNALLLGKSPAELAKDVSKYINPDVPGGVSYAASRLARTEIVNAYHHAARQNYIDQPWVKRVKWTLSGSHPKPDECNQYAENVHFRGGQAGEYKPEDVPAKPHPMCLCYITPVSGDLDDFQREFDNGDYDDEIDRLLGCSRAW